MQIKCFPIIISIIEKVKRTVYLLIKHTLSDGNRLKSGLFFSFYIIISKVP